MYNIKEIENNLKKYGYDYISLWLNDPCYDLPNELSEFQKVAEISGAINIQQVLFFMQLLNKIEKLKKGE